LNPIKLVARMLGLPEDDAADLLAEMVGFELEQTARKSKAGDLREQRDAEQTYIAKLGIDTRTANGCARLFAQRYGDRWRFDHAFESWFEWDETRWRRDGGQRGFQTIRELCADQATHYGSSVQSTLETAGFVQGVEKFARGEPALSVLLLARSGRARGRPNNDTDT